MLPPVVKGLGSLVMRALKFWLNFIDKELFLIIKPDLTPWGLGFKIIIILLVSLLF